MTQTRATECDRAHWQARMTRRAFSGLVVAQASLMVPGVGWAREPDVSDVVVVGSGAAGCTAALYAAQAGASVTVLEKAGFPGGTSAKSGGNIWIPNNAYMRTAGLPDPREAFLRFAARSSFPGRYDPAAPSLGLDPRSFELLATFYDHAAPVLEELGRRGVLRTDRFAFGSDDFPDVPDYHEQLAENAAAEGRVLSPYTPAGALGAGDELMRQLHAALARLRIPVLLRHRARALLRSRTARVTGVRATLPDGTERVFTARRGVVFATGGFTHDRALLARYHSDPVFGGCAVPTCTGDFMHLAEREDLALGNVGGAWRAQIVLEDALRYVSTPNNVWIPPGDAMLLVNRHGRRVQNEKRNYHDRTRGMYAWDASAAEYPNLLLFMIYDQRVAELWAGMYPLPDPPASESFVVSGPTLAALSAALAARLEGLAPRAGGVRLAADFADGLRATVQRFNDFAAAGRDRDFGRGEFRYDQVYDALLPARSSSRWPPRGGTNPTLRALAREGPYHAIILAPGTLDTNGGPLIDAAARVLDADLRPVPGLYGAGNAIASAAGGSYWGAGATLANAITFGAIAGRTAARGGAA